MWLVRRIKWNSPSKPWWIPMIFRFQFNRGCCSSLRKAHHFSIAKVFSGKPGIGQSTIYSCFPRVKISKHDDFLLTDRFTRGYMFCFSHLFVECLRYILHKYKICANTSYQSLIRAHGLSANNSQLVKYWLFNCLTMLNLSIYCLLVVYKLINYGLSYSSPDQLLSVSSANQLINHQHRWPSINPIAMRM